MLPSITATDACVTYNERTGMWKFVTECVVLVDGYAFVIPAGRETDLASVPTLLTNLLPRYGLSLKAPGVHDKLYEDGGVITIRTVNGDVECSPPFTRKQADAFLRDIAIAEGCPAWRANAAYYAVRLFGQRCWQPRPPSTEISHA